MIEKWLNHFVGWLFMVLFSLLAGCCLRFEVVTLPDVKTQEWMADTNTFNSAVKKEVEQHELRIQKLEQQGGSADGCTTPECAGTPEHSR